MDLNTEYTITSEEQYCEMINGYFGYTPPYVKTMIARCWGIPPKFPVLVKLVYKRDCGDGWYEVEWRYPRKKAQPRPVQITGYDVCEYWRQQADFSRSFICVASDQGLPCSRRGVCIKAQCQKGGTE